MKTKEFEKPAAAFEVNTQHNQIKLYSIRCILIEQGKVNSLKCVTNITYEKSAKLLRNYLERYWDTHNKILRFYDNPQNVNIKITNYCEVHPLEDLENILKKCYKRNKPKVKDDSENGAKSLVNPEYLKKYIAYIEKMKCPKCGKPLRLIESRHPQYKNEIAFTCTGYEKNKTAENNCRFLIPVTPLSYKIHKDKIEEFMYEHPSAYIAYSEWDGWED